MGFSFGGVTIGSISSSGVTPLLSQIPWGESGDLLKKLLFLVIVWRSPFWTVIIDPFFPVTTRGVAWNGDVFLLSVFLINTGSPILILLGRARAYVSAYFIILCFWEASRCLMVSALSWWVCWSTWGSFVFKFLPKSAVAGATPVVEWGVVL